MARDFQERIRYWRNLVSFFSPKESTLWTAFSLAADSSPRQQTELPPPMHNAFYFFNFIDKTTRRRRRRRRMEGKKESHWWRAWETRSIWGVKKAEKVFLSRAGKKKTYGVAHTTGNGSPFIPTAILSPPPPYSNAYIYKYTLAIIDQILFRRACTCVLNSGFRCGYLVEGTMSSSSCSSRAKVYK